MTGFPPKVRKLVHERSGGVCEVRWECDGAAATQIHHRRPRGSGGTRRPASNLSANALHLCVLCHQFIEQFRDESRRYGWLVRQYEEPAEVRVLRNRVYVRLDDDGGIHPVEENAA